MTNLRPAPVPVVIIGGFLGAGKTTLLNHILSEDHGLRAGVLVNDFGAVNIDSALVVGVEGETVSLANGCVCCTVRDDLVAASLGLLQRAAPPEILLVETSGVSDPVQVANGFLQPELQGLLSLSAILAVVDAQGFPELRGEIADLARRQLQSADLLLLNKVDLVGAKTLHDVKSLIGRTAPGSKIVETIEGRVPVDLILGAPPRGRRGRRSPLSTDASGRAHDRVFSNWHWRGRRPLSLPRLRAFLEDLPDTIYRAKGLVHLEDLPSYRIVLQMVGRRYNLRDAGPWAPGTARSEIVMIGAAGAFEDDDLGRALDACAGEGDEAASPVFRLARKILRDDRPWT